MRGYFAVGFVLAYSSFSAFAQPSPSHGLEELRMLPKPKQQTDLDLVRIAPIERQMTSSVEERTSGLWQSWLFAVCRGCGVERQRTVAEINAAVDAYARPGDGRLLRRLTMSKPSTPLDLLPNHDRSMPRIMIAERAAGGR